LKEVPRSTNSDSHPSKSEINSKTGIRPTYSIRGSGGLMVAIWRDKSDGGDSNYSICADRSYQNSKGNFEITNYFRDEDLLRLSTLLEMADTWIEQDKSKYQKKETQDKTR